MTKKHKFLRILCAVLSILVIFTGAELIWSNYAITISRYSVHSNKISSPFRLVFLSDLHGREFGKDNSRLVRKITAENPDLIAFVGDIFNSDADEEEIDAMCSLIRQCSGIAPVYFSMGNHEAAFIKAHGTDLIGRITAAGAVVVDVNYFDLSINGSQVRIGGYMGYFSSSLMTTSDKAQQQLEAEFSKAFKDTDQFKLLLNHIPTSWLDWGYIDKDSVDLVLSGHYHGGVIRIPIWEQGLYAPYVGKFPPYTKGMFVGKKATCILTTGMAGSYGLPRFFNPPEICVVDILPGT